MFNILPPMCFTMSTWEDAVKLCTYMICKTAIIITGLILAFFAIKYLIVNISRCIAQSIRNSKILKELNCTKSCSNYSSSNNTDCAKKSNNKSEKETKPKEHKS